MALQKWLPEIWIGWKTRKAISGFFHVASIGLAGKNSLTWTSKYGYIITAAYDIGSTDGINEKNLSGHLLWFAESDYGKRESVPGLSVGLWLQYFLDNFASVDEGVLENHPFRLLTGMGANTGKIAELHLMIEDSTGDAAVFEYVNGERK